MKGFERRQTKKSFYSSPPSSHFFHLSICLPYVCLVSCVVQSLQVMNTSMVMSCMIITSDQWSKKGFVIIILVMNIYLTKYS
jgi:hypothetical protein